MTYPIVGMIGGGQLARMTHQASIALSVGFRVLAETPTDSAALVARDVRIGDHRDLDTLLDFAAGCHAVTFDHEHVSPRSLRALEQAGVRLRPGSEALRYAQDKGEMRERLTAAGVPCPRWRYVESVADVAEFAAETGWPVVLKTARGGYDGKGVWVLDDLASTGTALAQLAGVGCRLLAEEKVTFRRELAALVARSPHGQGVAYPVVETVQVDGVCREVYAPAPGLDPELAAQAQETALKIAAELDVTGVLAVELFETGTGILVNELAMRPHNSGHWTIDGAVTSQFEQHLRAVLDLPLGSPDPIAPHTVMVNVLGGEEPDLYGGYEHCLARDPGLRIHTYGKPVRPGRKVGHVTVYGDDFADVLERARHAAAHLRGTE